MRKLHIRRYCWNGFWVWAAFRRRASPKPFVMAGRLPVLCHKLKARHA